jgi:hypothetical protein
MWELICHHTYKYKGFPVDLTNYNNDGDYPVAADFAPNGAAPGSGALSFTRPEHHVAIARRPCWQTLIGLRVECVLRINQHYPGKPQVVIAGANSFAFEIRQAGLYASFVGPSTVPGASRDGLDTYQHLLPGSPAYVVPVGTWLRCGFAHDGLDTMELYADGRVLARRRGLLVGVPAVGPTGVSIGNVAAPDMQHVLDGDIDEIKVWRLNPRATWRDFVQRPIDGDQADCWAQFASKLAVARAKHPDCAKELRQSLRAAIERILRAIAAKGMKEREHFAKLHDRYLELWRAGDIDGPRMRKLIAEWIAWLHALGVSLETDADLRAIAGSRCFKLMLKACKGIDCDEDFTGLIRIVDRAVRRPAPPKRSRRRRA